MRLFVWNERKNLLCKNDVLCKASAIVIAESLSSAIALVKNSKFAQLGTDYITDEINNLPDLNTEVRTKNIHVWVFETFV